jgi:uroporphyrinogen decarboxylase
MTAREIVKARFAHKPTDVTPYSVHFEDALAQRLTEHYADPNWQAKKLRNFVCAYLGVDTVGMRPVDDVYALDRWGARWRMDRKPWSLETPTAAELSFDAFEFPSSKAFVDPILRDKPAAIEKYNANQEQYRLIDMGWGVYEHSWRILGFEEALMAMITDEDFYAALVQKITDIYIDMLRALEDVPADGILFGDDWGEQRGVIMGPDRWRRFIKPCWARIYKEVHRQGKIAIQHSCGSIYDIYEDLYEIGMDVHESVQPEAKHMAPALLQSEFGRKLSFWGCLGNQSILHTGTGEEIAREIHRLDDLFKPHGGYLLAPAKPLPDEMDIARAVAVVETLSNLQNG